MVNVPASCNSCSRQHYRPATTATAAAPTTLPSSCITMAAVSSACKDNVMSLGTEHVHCCASDRTKARNGAVYRICAEGKFRMKTLTRRGINEHGKKKKTINLHLYNTIARPASAFNHLMLNHKAASRWTKAGNMDYNYSSVQEHGKQEELAATSLLNVGHIHLSDHSLQTAALSINTYNGALTLNNNNNQNGKDATRFGGIGGNVLYDRRPPTTNALSPNSTSLTANKPYPQLRIGHYTCRSGRNGHHYHGHNRCNLSRKHRHQHHQHHPYQTQDDEDCASLSTEATRSTTTTKRIIVLSKHRDRRRLADLRMLLTFMCLTVLFPLTATTATSRPSSGEFFFI